jgi:sulfur carrier protein
LMLRYRFAMQLTVNNELFSVSAPASLQGFLAELRLDEKKGIAVAVNDAIVARSTWNTFALKENDSITIIQATQGG